MNAVVLMASDSQMTSALPVILFESSKRMSGVPKGRIQTMRKCTSNIEFINLANIAKWPFLTDIDQIRKRARNNAFQIVTIEHQSVKPG